MSGADLFEGYVGIRLWDGQQVDDIIFALLLFLLITFALVFQMNFRLFLKMVKDVLFIKERHSLFELTAGHGIFFRNFMIFQMLFLCSITLFTLARADGYLIYLKGAGVLVALLAILGALLLFYLFKRCLYFLFACVFVELERYRFWKTNYNAIMSAWGVLLYLPVLWLVFIGTYLSVPAAMFAILYFSCRFVVIYKTIRIFHSKNTGLLYISLYLCGQEILPLVFLYEGMVCLYNFIETSTLWH